MPSLVELNRRPAGLVADTGFQPWFAAIATRLLNGCDFLAAGQQYRLAEVEMYYSGPEHHDPFSHREPIQRECGRWYFHRTHGVYRGGSFKGLDLTLGDGTAHFGVIIRSVVGLNGTMIDGPCVLVDQLLARTQMPSVAALDALIGTRPIWDATAPLSIVESPSPRSAMVYATSRVGLSLKRAENHPAMPRFVGRAYRFLTEPATIAKGRVHLVLALHRAGHTPDAIHTTTRVPRKAIARYITDFKRGVKTVNFDRYFGKNLNTHELCQLLGTWQAAFGTSTARDE